MSRWTDRLDAMLAGPWASPWKATARARPPCVGGGAGAPQPHGHAPRRRHLRRGRRRHGYDDESFTTLELDAKFLRPVWEGTLTAEARVVKKGRRTGLVECDVTDEEGRLVARVSSTCLTLKGEARGR